ncbi:alpha/beta hydrolase family protein [Chrysiogenes arsenatis]|uniref:alpha/beta hydrolase family protein n=1 Tax=Chrysiogenes arsenatis TaxID=309797 RepID=UPI0004027A16|nr:prolyl oligopeptidase family serine peptidase [Chrysiogenes arsenatis]
MLVLLLVSIRPLTSTATTVADLEHYVYLSQPQLTDTVAAVVVNSKRIDLYDHDGTRIDSLESPRGSITQLTAHATQPELFFLASDTNNRRQVFRWNHAHATVQQLTSFDAGVLLFSLGHDALYLAVNSGRLNAKTHDPIQFHDLYQQTIATRETTPLLQNQPLRITSLDVAPDEQSLLFAAHRDEPIWYPVDYDIFLFDTTNRSLTTLVERPAMDAAPRFSPDGSRFLYLSANGVPGWGYQLQPRIYDFATGSDTPLAIRPPDDCRIATWVNNHTVQYLSVAGMQQRLITQTTGATPQETQFPSPHYIENYASRGATTLLLSVHIDEPEELSFFMGNTLRWRTHYNKQTRDLPRGATVPIAWQSGEQTIHGLLTFPVHYDANKRYPLILNLHGGPADVYTERFSGYPYFLPVQVMAHRGAFVLRPNPRGSAGWGLQFRRANIGDWGGGDVDDVIAGVDFAIAHYAVDTNELSVAGWSYGGYLSAMAISRYPERFRRAIIGAGITNLTSYINSTLYTGFAESYMGDLDQLPLLIERSPLFYTKSVQAEVLLIHGTRDRIVPYAQGIEYYNALLKHGVRVHFDSYPFAHSYRHSGDTAKLQQRVVDFLLPE